MSVHHHGNKKSSNGYLYICFLAILAKLVRIELGTPPTFGYLVLTPEAKDVLEGSYTYPPHMDAPTVQICKEVARIQQMIPRETAGFVIMMEKWKEIWSKANKETSSSQSGQHFISQGHRPM